MSFNAPHLVGQSPRSLTVREIYDGSDGDATRALYSRLDLLGPAGTIALNLFRAQKNSSRAKVYRGGIRGQGSYKSMAYDRKNYAVTNLTHVLDAHGAALGIRWGWQRDDATPAYEWVLYVDVPDRGQASFHMDRRGLGPDYPGVWDGQRGMSHLRIIAWCEQLLASAAVTS
jgi:hypothetical protein